MFPTSTIHFSFDLPRREPVPISRLAAESLHIYAVVNDANLLCSKVILRQDRVPHRIRIGQHSGRKHLQAAKPHAAASFVQVEMRQIALARNDHRNARERRRRNAQQVRIKIVSVNNLEAAPTQEDRQTKHLIHPVDRIEPTLGIELADGNAGSRQLFKQRAARSQAPQRYVVALRVESDGQLDSLRLGPADVQRIQQKKHFPSPTRSRRYDGSIGTPQPLRRIRLDGQRPGARLVR